jgi:hypothetical protein
VEIYTQRESCFIALLKTSLIAIVVLQGCVSARINIIPPGAELFTLPKQEYSINFTSIRPFMSTLP